jgi:hypothetical protein
MLRLTRIRRRALASIAYDERTGAVCDARCRAGAQRERDHVRALARRGPHL